MSMNKRKGRVTCRSRLQFIVAGVQGKSAGLARKPSVLELPQRLRPPRCSVVFQHDRAVRMHRFPESKEAL
jgi:hypothetical protein